MIDDLRGFWPSILPYVVYQNRYPRNKFQFKLVDIEFLVIEQDFHESPFALPKEEFEDEDDDEDEDDTCLTSFTTR